MISLSAFIILSVGSIVVHEFLPLVLKMGDNEGSLKLPDSDETKVYLISWEPVIAFGHTTHVAVAVFGKLIQFSISGLEITTGGELKTYTMELLGNTHKSYSDFTHWYQKKNKEQFKRDDFEIVDNNCLIFAKELAAFLGVKFSPKAQAQLDWVQENPKKTRFFSAFSPSVHS